MKHQHFEIGPGVMVLGDPKMSEKTKAALLRMVELASQQITDNEFSRKTKSAEAEIKLEDDLQVN